MGNSFEIQNNIIELLKKTPLRGKGILATMFSQKLNMTESESLELSWEIRKAIISLKKQGKVIVDEKTHNLKIKE
jgi:hypothetical protein